MIYFAVGNCQLQATVRTIEIIEKQENNQFEEQTQLQLLCRNVTCPMINSTCDTYNEFNISRGIPIIPSVNNIINK